jgi:hypothetical protein
MFEAKVHCYSAPFSGDRSAAMGIARAALLSQGFEILSDTGSELRARGPGMHSNAQPALMGATDFLIQVGASTVGATATLGGIARMKAFLFLFPPGVVLFLGLFSVLAGNPQIWSTLILGAAWLLLAPLFTKLLEYKTTRAVDALIRGMAQAGFKPRSSGPAPVGS